MRRRDILRIVSFICLILVVEVLLARGGGGGGHGGGAGHSGGGHSSGGGHGGFGGGGHGDVHSTIWGFIIFGGFVLFGLFATTTATLLLWKSNISKKILSKIISTDSFWDFEGMQLNARRTFYNIQDAWENRDIDSVKNNITPELHDKYKVMLSEMTSRNEKNIISQIDITETKIIGSQDYKDDSKDRYVAYIKGTILDYTINDKTGEIIKNPSKEIEEFSDTYHFIREGKRWILEHIDNNVSLLDIVTSKNYKE